MLGSRNYMNEAGGRRQEAGDSRGPPVAARAQLGPCDLFFGAGDVAGLQKVT